MRTITRNQVKRTDTGEAGRLDEKQSWFMHVARMASNSTVGKNNDVGVAMRTTLSEAWLDIPVILLPRSQFKTFKVFAGNYDYTQVKPGHRGVLYTAHRRVG